MAHCVLVDGWASGSGRYSRLLLFGRDWLYEGRHEGIPCLTAFVHSEQDTYFLPWNSGHPSSDYVACCKLNTKSTAVQD